MERIGLYGGSFDPIHLGHLLVAQAAREEIGLDRIVFIPAAQSPFKPQSHPIEAGQRLRLLRLALAGHPEYAVDEQELRRGGVSYTINTVQSYRSRYPGAELFYLIGADHVRQLPQWREARLLAGLVRFVVVPRPGETPAPLPEPFQGTLLRGHPLGVSSSEIRSRIREGKPIRNLVCDAVAEAIWNNHLYL